MEAVQYTCEQRILAIAIICLYYAQGFPFFLRGEDENGSATLKMLLQHPAVRSSCALACLDARTSKKD